MAAKSDLIDVTAAGVALGVKRRQVVNLIATGLLPAQKIGNAWVVKKADLAKVPKDRKPGPKPKAKK